MRHSNVALGFCAIAGVLGALWALRLLDAERTHRLALEAEVAALREPASPAASPAPADPTTRDAAPSSASAVRSPAPMIPATTPPAQDVDAHLRAMAKREQAMLRDSAYREAQLADYRRRYAAAGRDGMRVVGMTRAQADRVVALWAERNLRFTELGIIPGQPPDENMRAELKRASDAEQEELRALLGDAKYEDWQRFLAAGQERAEVQQFRAEFADTPNALRDAQADSLAMTIYSERQRLSREYDDYANAEGITDRYVVRPQDRQRWLELARDANQRIHDAMATSLSTPQLALLDDMLAARLAPAEAALRMQLEGGLTKE